MKYKLVILAAIFTGLYGCGTARPTGMMERPRTEALSSQTLNTSFVGEGIKIEWECMFPTGMMERTCIRTNVKSIEATGYAPSFGNSDAARNKAIKVAEQEAFVRLRSFVTKSVNSSVVTNTMAKNLEVAKDRYKQRIEGESVAMTDKEAEKDTNFAVRENSNDIARTVQSSITTRADGIVKGAYPISARAVSSQTIGVTIRWSPEANDVADMLAKRWGG